MKKQFSVAVVGSGYWGRNLVRNFNSLGALKLICDKNENVLAGFREDYPEAETCLSLKDVLSNPEVDGVVFATPAETHFTLVNEALHAGKHVFVEKPLALSEADGKALIGLAGENGLVLMVGHLLQYHPVFLSLKELVRQGELGRIDYIYSNRLNLGKIRREENIWWSFAPHDISMILSLAGEEPESVSATGGYYLHKKIADVTMTNLEFSSGLKAHIFVSWLHPFKEQKLVVVGERKMAVFDDTLPWEDKLLLYPHRIDWKEGMPVPTKGEAERLEIARDEPLRAECQHFLECIAQGTSPRTDGEEGLRVLRVLNAAQESMDRMCSVRAGTRTEQDYYSHESAVVDEDVEIGKGSRIWHFSHILPGSRIGENCSIGQNVVIGPDVAIGKGCKIQNNVSVYKGVTLEDHVFCGPSMVFTNVFNPRASIRRMDELRATLVRTGATLGANSTIVCGVTIGRHAFVGAGAVVTRSVPDYAVVYGNPARQQGWICQCGEKLDCMDGGCLCHACETRYELEDGALAPV